MSEPGKLLDWDSLTETEQAEVLGLAKQNGMTESQVVGWIKTNQNNPSVQSQLAAFRANRLSERNVYFFSQSLSKDPSANREAEKLMAQIRKPLCWVDGRPYWNDTLEPIRKDGEKLITRLKGENRPGRNEPCPCKSGKKYKRCCGE